MRSHGLTIQNCGICIKTSTLDFIMYGLSYCSSRSTWPPIFEGENSNACWNNRKTGWKNHHFPIILKMVGFIQSYINIYIIYIYISISISMVSGFGSHLNVHVFRCWPGSSRSREPKVCQPMGNPWGHGGFDGKVMGKSWDYPWEMVVLVCL